MRVSALVSIGALLAAATTSAAAQRPAPPEPPEPPPAAPRAPATPRAPAAPRAPRAPRAPQPPSVARAAPDVWTFGFGDARADRAALGIVLGEAGTGGLRVAEVADDGPAARAGVRVGDRIVAVGDVDLRLDARDADDPLLRMTSERRLRRELERLDAGDEVTLRVASGDAERTVRVRTVRADALGEGPDRAPTMARSAPRAGTLLRTLPARRPDRASIGLTLGATGSARDTLGVFVAGVAEDGPAERAGIHEGMRIAAIGDVDLRAGREEAERDHAGRRAAERAARLERELARLEPGDEVTLRVWDGGRMRDVRVRSARASEVYRGDAAWGPGGAIFGMPGAEALRGLEARERARGEVRVVPRGSPRVLRIAPSVRVAPDVRVEIEDLPDVEVEIHGLDDLSPEERARVERRLEEVRGRLEATRARMDEVRERMLESRVEERARAATLRAMPTVVWPRRWMD